MTMIEGDKAILPRFTDAQIEHMISRFLTWRIPDDFQPDNGVSFEPFGNVGTAMEYRRELTGTNLFGPAQTREMIEHMLDGLP